MEKKKIYLIGLNLYSIFLSLKIRSINKNVDITIIEGSKNFLNAYSPIKIKKYHVNPGFHSFEDIRSKKLINFLANQIKFKKIFKSRGILIGDNLISWLDGYHKWPKKIIERFKISKEKIVIDINKNLESLNKNYLRYLTDNYFGAEVKIKPTINSAFPWFFPRNYSIISSDEAAIFNNKIRNNNIRHAFVFPKGGLFNQITDQLRKKLKKNKINVKLNTPVEFYKKQKKYIGLKVNNEISTLGGKKIICIPVVPLFNSIKDSQKDNKLKKKLTPIKYYTGLIEVQDFRRNDLDKFCEIIVSSEFAYGLKRISNYSETFEIKNKKIYQIEFIQHHKERNVNHQINQIMDLMSKFIEFKKKNKGKNLKLIGFSFLRYVFRPEKNYINYLTFFTAKYFKKDNDFLFPRQITWPINSNKHFLYAEEDFKNKIKSFIND